MVLYHIEDAQRPAQKRNILRLNVGGKCALNVVDNLILVHHQPSKATYIYDIEELSTAQTDGFQTIHQPLLPGLSIQPVNANWQPLVPTMAASQPSIELYSTNWIVFLPNVIIDVMIGCLWYLSINLDYLLDLITDRLFLTDILLRRANGKTTMNTLLRTLLSNVISPVQIDSENLSDANASAALECWTEMVNRINRGYGENGSNNPMLNQTDMASILSFFQTWALMPSSSTYNRSLSIASTDELLYDREHNKKVNFAISVILEYIRSLNDCNVTVQFPIFEILVNLLVRNNQFFQLQQLIQYQVLTDSRSLGMSMRF